MALTLMYAVTLTLLVLGVLGCAFTAVALLIVHDVFDQIQYLASASLVGTIGVVSAVLLHEGLHQAGIKALLIALLLICANPILSHATARAARIRHKGQWEPAQGESVSEANGEKP